MSQKDYDEALHWRLEMLRAMFEDGKMMIAEHLAEGVENSLSMIRYGADGKIDLSTVDGRIRSMALMAGHATQRNEAKDSMSLSDISATYFGFIERNLGFIDKEYKKTGLNAHQFARAASQNDVFVEDVCPQIPAFLDALQDFWKTVSDPAYYHIQDLSGSKAVYGGDLFPSHEQNIASTAGLYIDTIVLSCPFGKSRHVFDHGTKENQTYYFVKHTLNVLQYKDLATANTSKPIIAFAPYKSTVDDDEKEFLQKVMTADGLTHAGHLFGRSFSDTDELFEYVDKLKTPDVLVAALADPNRLVFDTEWTGGLEEQIRRSLDSTWNEMAGVGDHAGRLVAAQSLSRMGQATDILFTSRYLSGVPLIDAPTSWKYFNWKLDYNSVISPEDQKSLHMVHGLQRAAATDEEWLGKIPPDALIEMRNVGAFEEIRSVISAGVDSLAEANPDSFFRSSDQIVDNIREAFERHKNEVSDLTKKKIRFAGHDVGSMLTAGAIDIASMVTGFGTFGAASLAVNQLVDAPTLREIPERFRNLKDAHIKLKKSPMGLFFAHRSKN